MIAKGIERAIKDLSLIIVGIGQVGEALLRQVLSGRGDLAGKKGIRLRIVGLADSQGALLDRNGLTDSAIAEALQAKAAGRSIGELPSSAALPPAELTSAFQPGTVLVDTTASAEMEPILRAALDAGCGVVLANKRPLAGPWADSRAFFEHPHLRYEATVGAGLPVISTLRTLLDTGDRVTVIDGVLSGTLQYLCGELARGIPYSAALSQARALGYTEPDPREDLSGGDVARKALILARTAGWALEMNDLTVERLYPEDLAGLSTDAFMEAVPILDEELLRRVERARSRRRVLRYIARIDPDGGEVGLAAVERDSSLGGLCNADNAIAFQTERYAQTPLIVSGPGAGPQVTAAGVLGDIIRLSEEINEKPIRKIRSNDFSRSQSG